MPRQKSAEWADGIPSGKSFNQSIIDSDAFAALRDAFPKLEFANAVAVPRSGRPVRAQAKPTANTRTTSER